MHNIPSYDISGGSSGDSGHVSETDNRLSTKMRRSSTSGTDLRHHFEASRYGSNFIQSRRTSSSKNSGPLRQGSLSSAEGAEAAQNGFLNPARAQEMIYFQAPASSKGPEFRGGLRNATRRKTGLNAKESRRNSIGCMYQIWSLASNDANGPHENVVTNGFDVAIDSSAFEEEGDPQQPVLPPLKGPGRQPDAKTTTRGKNSAQSRRRNNSGPERSFLQSSRSDERRASISPVPPGRRIPTGHDRRSASVDYSAMRPDFKLSTGRKSPSPYKPAHRRNESNGKGSLSNEQQNTFIVSRTSPPHSNGDVRKTYAVIPSGVQAFGPNIPPSSGEPTLIPRPKSHKLRVNFRSNSVYSPSSGGSADRPPDRVVIRGNRRASLPNTALFGSGTFDTNRSPEYDKTVNELRKGPGAFLETRDLLDQRTPSARSGSTVNSYKDQMGQGAPSTVARRDQLQRIEENPNDASTLGQSQDLSKVTEAFATGAPEGGISAEMSQLKLTETARDDSAYVEGNEDEETNDEMPAQKRARESSPQNKSKNVVKKKAETKPKSQSLFHIPGPGATKKVESHLAQTTEISPNEGNLHYVAGARTKEEALKHNSEYLSRVYGEEHNFTQQVAVDQSLLNEDDDDLCEEDFQQKRIIRWLLGVQTGSMAEQVVRDRTPPPSPQPNQQTAIVVVYNGDNNSW